MSNELTVQTLGDAVKDKVRKAMMDAIPDEALHAMITTEFNSFFVDKAPKYHNDNTESEFKKLVRLEINAAMKISVHEHVKKKTDILIANYDNGENNLIGSLVEEMSSFALKGVMRNIVSNCINNLKNGNAY